RRSSAGWVPILVRGRCCVITRMGRSS
ncbi:hypothetical protein Misp01_53240, partial [Microtetraspora sp. NBRC 13810]